jgi:flagellar P-ring protein precursor FlgI
MKFLSKVTLLILTIFSATILASNVRIKELARIQGVQDNPLVGYGLVVGLSGTGDSSKNHTTILSLSNTLKRFSVNVTTEQIRSRNVAAVIVTASLPAFAQTGDRLDVTVSSIGDARSLQGGTLLMIPLKAANQDIYALAQGPLSVGGYQFDYNGNKIQKNHPTVGIVPNGANVEKSIEYGFDVETKGLTLQLNSPDFTTARRIIKTLKEHFPESNVTSNHPGRVTIKLNKSDSLISLMFEIESLSVTPDTFARVVINERNGTVVAGSQVRIDDVVISHGSLTLQVKTEFTASQPSGFFRNTGDDLQSLVIANSEISVEENTIEPTVFKGSNIGELVNALKSLNLPTRELISILQAIKKSGALHAELIIQ